MGQGDWTPSRAQSHVLPNIQCPLDTMQIIGCTRHITSKLFFKIRNNADSPVKQEKVIMRNKDPSQSYCIISSKHSVYSSCSNTDGKENVKKSWPP